jgi:hypothetical protein
LTTLDGRDPHGPAEGTLTQLAGLAHRAVAELDEAAGVILAPALPIDHLDAVPDDRLYGFAHFWEAWPRRAGKRLHRGHAEAQWKTLTLRQRKAAWRGAVNYAMACDLGTQGAIDAFRWLRDRSWDDWQEPPTPHRPPGTAATTNAAAAANIRTGQTSLIPAAYQPASTAIGTGA